MSSNDRPMLGIALIVLAMLVVPIQDGIAKYLTAYYPVSEIVWGRFWAHILILSPFILWRYGPRALKPKQWGLQILRGVFMLGSTFFFFAAVKRMPMADTLALVFFYPFVVTGLSSLLLNEKVGIRRWSAVTVGFIGTLIIIRPGSDVFDPWSLFALCGGSSYALYLITTRKLSGSAPPLVTLWYTAAFGAVAMSFVAPFEWVTPTPEHAGLMVFMGANAIVAHFMLIKALDYAPASLLAPFGYTELVMATAIGYFWFGDFPDHWTWVGAAIIVGSGIYISVRESRLRKA